MTTASPAVQEIAPQPIVGTLLKSATSLSPTVLSSSVAGGTAYLSLAPNLTTLTMYRYQLDALPDAVREAAASVITTGWTGVAMLVTAGFAYLITRLGRAGEA
ncbi:hypothetical protein [Dongia sp.]|uniref:hypothetical protein n=1 Tax=Dongia sp. TaxID=1977262 RepID=UPI0035B33221